MPGYAGGVSGSRRVQPLVAVVDDDEQVLNLLRQLFELEGFAVVEARDGLEALEVVAAERPDALVLDIMMPRLDGLSVLRRLRAGSDHRGLPVILLSAKATEDDVAAGLEAGADAYVTKPFEPLELVERVMRLLDVA